MPIGVAKRRPRGGGLVNPTGGMEGNSRVRWRLAVHHLTMGNMLRGMQGVACYISHNGSTDHSRAKAIARVSNATSGLRDHLADRGVHDEGASLRNIHIRPMMALQLQSSRGAQLWASDGARTIHRAFATANTDSPLEVDIVPAYRQRRTDSQAVSMDQ